MKLYIYDHCPFCIRARMPLGLFRIDFEQIVLPNDDEDTPIGMIGAKQVPILQKPDGSYMGESLDIVRWLVAYAGKHPLPEAVRPQVQTLLDKIGRYQNKLLWPRDVKLGLPEFATQSAIEYFKNKKEAAIGDFDTNFNETPALLTQLDADLAGLETWVSSADAFSAELSMEDILVFPVLRNLTMVSGLSLPPKLHAYVAKMAEAAAIPLYYDRAI